MRTFQGGSFIRLYKNGALDVQNTTNIVATVTSSAHRYIFANSADNSLIKYLMRVSMKSASTTRCQRARSKRLQPRRSKFNKTPTNTSPPASLTGHLTALTPTSPLTPSRQIGAGQQRNDDKYVHQHFARPGQNRAGA